MISAANAFSYASSGSMSESTMSQYADLVQADAERIKKLGGWLGGRVESSLNRFNNFVNSRVWELSKRLSGKGDGEYVGRFDIGFLGSVSGLQNATGVMRDYILANPEVRALVEDKTFEGYGGEVSKFNTGIGRDNLYYRRAMNGVLDVRKEEDVAKASFSYYHDSVSSNELSQRERVNIQQTWRAAQYHIAAGLFDITSPSGRKLTDEDVEESEESYKL